MKELWIRNRQRRHRVDLAGLRRVTRHLLEDTLLLPGYQLGIHLVGPRAMSRLNRTFLAHEGPTDVLTFDHARPGHPLYGELFVCPAVAALQAGEFRSSQAQELVRYVVHGVLHLSGFDDTTPPARRRMKRVEDRLMTRLRQGFLLSNSAIRPRLTTKR